MNTCFHVEMLGKYDEWDQLCNLISSVTHRHINVKVTGPNIKSLMSFRYKMISELERLACQYEEEGCNIIIKSTHSTVFFEGQVQGQQFQYIAVDEHNKLLEDINF